MSPITIAIVAVIVVGVVALSVYQGDDLLDGLDNALTGALAVVAGAFTLTASLLGDLGGLVAEFPGVAASAVLGAVGSLGLGGYVELALPGMLTLTLVVIAGTLVVREAT